MFRTSSFCKTDTPMCVEVGGLDTDTVMVRNTKARMFSIGFTREEWAAFVDGVKAGEFDLAPQGVRT